MCRFIVIQVMLILAQCATAQDTIPVYQEPFHHLVFQNDEIRILDVRLEPGDTSAWHSHRHAITYVGLEGSRILLDVPGEHPRSVYLPDDFWGGDTDYPEAPFVHRIANVGLQVFHLLAIEHLQTRQHHVFTEDALDGWEALDVNPYFLLHRAQLAVGASQEAVLHGPAMLVARGKGMLVAQHAGTISSLRNGDWLAWPNGLEDIRLSNSGKEPMEVLLIHL